MEAEKIARINELAKKRKSPEGLTAEEEAFRIMDAALDA